MYKLKIIIGLLCRYDQEELKEIWIRNMVHFKYLHVDLFFINSCKSPKIIKKIKDNIFNYYVNTEDSIDLDEINDEKTMSFFNYLSKINYKHGDFIIRTDISCLLDLLELFKFINTQPKKKLYGSFINNNFNNIIHDVTILYTPDVIDKLVYDDDNHNKVLKKIWKYDLNHVSIPRMDFLEKYSLFHHIRSENYVRVFCFKFDSKNIKKDCDNMNDLIDNNYLFYKTKFYYEKEIH
jgi:hypothetical protein